MRKDVPVPPGIPAPSQRVVLWEIPVSTRAPRIGVGLRAEPCKVPTCGPDHGSLLEEAEPGLRRGALLEGKDPEAKPLPGSLP